MHASRCRPQIEGGHTLPLRKKKLKSKPCHKKPKKPLTHLIAFYASWFPLSTHTYTQADRDRDRDTKRPHLISFSDSRCILLCLPLMRPCCVAALSIAGCTSCWPLSILMHWLLDCHCCSLAPSLLLLHVALMLRVGRLQALRASRTLSRPSEQDRQLVAVMALALSAVLLPQTEKMMPRQRGFRLRTLAALFWHLPPAPPPAAGRTPALPPTAPAAHVESPPSCPEGV